jgi:hypothetical protein
MLLNHDFAVFFRVVKIEFDYLGELEVICENL